MFFCADISYHWNLNKARFKSPQHTECVPSFSKVERQRKADMRSFYTQIGRLYLLGSIDFHCILSTTFILPNMICTRLYIL